MNEVHYGFTTRNTYDVINTSWGGMAEWLGSGLQIHLRGFEFLYHLHLKFNFL